MENKHIKRIQNLIKTKRFLRKLDKRLVIGMGYDEKEIKTQHKNHYEQIKSFLLKNEISYYSILDFIANVDSYDDVIASFKVILKAETLGLNEYIDIDTVIKILKKDFDPYFYFGLAKDFKNYKLEENGQGDFNRLRKYVEIPEKSLKDIVDVMLFTKNAGHPLSQKNVVKYFDSKRPDTEDVFKLKDAWIFAKEHEFEIDIYDFIQAMKYNRDPMIFVINYNKIISNDIPISFENFKILNIEQDKIGELITLLIKAKMAGIYLDFETIYDDILQNRDVWSIIQYIIKFQDAGFDDFDYNDLRYFFIYGGDLKNLYSSYLYNRKHNIISPKKLYKSTLEILIVKNKELNFNSYFLLKAIEIAKSDDFNINADDIINDYLAGHNVFGLILDIIYARKNNVQVTYPLAKFLDTLDIGFNNLVIEALNPVMLAAESVNVTTKDNIEITANIEIEAVIQLDNYVKGSDKEILFTRANAIFIDEIQRKYNHDEIIGNIEKIGNNILYRLNNESRDRKYNYIPDNQMKKVKNEQQEENFSSNYNYNDHNQDLKFVDVSKYKPLKVLIPRITFNEESFKNYDKIKEKFELHKKREEAKIDKIKAEIEVKRAWAKSKDLKYLILKDDDEKSDSQH
ncbi:MAG: flotillin-like FloA family protein [Bacteroidota bacterium]|nr:flotillin-like FloA family protein [Bacteroidota bacterium]